jgi:hypothetical protein
VAQNPNVRTHDSPHDPSRWALATADYPSTIETIPVLSEYSEKLELLLVPGVGASCDVEKRLFGGRCLYCADPSTVRDLCGGEIVLAGGGSSSPVVMW